MSSKIVPLNRKSHSNLRIRPSTDFSFIAKQQILPITAHEILVAASEFPVVFVKDSTTDSMQLAVICGLKQGENLYAGKTVWPGIYMPAIVKNYPFSLVLKSEGSDDVALCIDEECEQFNDKEGVALFDEEGGESEFLKAVTERLLTTHAQIKATVEFTKFLTDNDLLSAQQLTINSPGGEPYNIKGIYVVDETKLKNLGVDVLTSIHSKGILPIIYAHLVSLHQVERLARMHIEQSSS